MLLDLQNVPNPTPNIHSFTMPWILKVFSWLFKAYFPKEMLDKWVNPSLSNF
jgi:hypothetical protein